MTIVVTVRYHNLFRRAAGSEKERLCLASGSSIHDALEQLTGGSDGALQSLLFTAERDVVAYLVVFRNQRLVTHDQFDTQLVDGDELQLFPAVAGG